jgi:glycosyltransferase involved in cell wall biosynthesis
MAVVTFANTLAGTPSPLHVSAILCERGGSGGRHVSSPWTVATPRRPEQYWQVVSNGLDRLYVQLFEVPDAKVNLAHRSLDGCRAATPTHAAKAVGISSQSFSSWHGHDRASAEFHRRRPACCGRGMADSQIGRCDSANKRKGCNRLALSRFCSMKILVSANGIHTSTGYGTQAKLLCRMFQSLGHEVAVLCTYGVQGGVLTIEGIPHYPTFRDSWGQDIVGQVVKHFGADCVLTLHDIWVMTGNFQQAAGVPHIAYFPVDSEPAAPATVRQAKLARYPVTYSQFGHDQMLKAGVTTDYIPHAVDCEVFCPGDKGEARKALGLPSDKFIVAMVGANKGYPSRKAFPEQMMAFAEFRKTHEDALLLLHTQKSPVGHWADGLHLDGLIQNLGIADSIITTNEWMAASGLFGDKDVANVYRAADVLLHASYAEGFGLCIAEAQACGCPVITTDFSSMPELTVNGYAVEEVQRVWSLLGCWQAVPDVIGITDCLKAIYESRDETAFRMEGIAHIQDHYSIPIITEQWRTSLDNVSAELADLKAMTATGD